MPERNDLLIGQIALERKLITPEQLREALAGRPRRLGVALVAKGYLTDHQLVALIDEQRRRMNAPPNYADVRKGDILFGKLLVRDGRATEEQVNAALRRQQELAEEGAIRRLGEILELPDDTVKATLQAQGKTLMSCPGCGTRFNVVGATNVLQCRKCGMRLELATEGIGADETSFHLPRVKEDLTESYEEALDDPKKRFGKYVLIRKVGEGGFGAVYQAYEKGLGRTVALKFLHGESPEDLQRFAREAQLAARLSHPHIVPLHEVGEQDGKHYLAMDFVEGETLNKLRLESRRAAEVMRDVAGTVHYAHEKGIVHRDLKPQNLMMGPNGHVWVMDFGLARRLRGGSTLTMSGSVVGTPAYMPPEQARGERCDERSDVYSLGATLYDLLTGRPPFEGPDPLAVLDKARIEEPIPPRKLNPKIDPEIETIVAKAMEKAPGRRYRSAREFAEDLGRHLAGEPILARPASLGYRIRKQAARHRGLLIGVAAVAAIAIAAVVLVVSARRKGAEYQASYQRGIEAWEKATHLARVEGADRKPLETLIARAKSEFRRAAEISPGSPEPWFMLGRCEALLGAMEDAERMWSEALARDPAHGPALFERGKYYLSTYAAAKVQAPETSAERELRAKGVRDLDRARRLEPAAAKGLEGMLALGDLRFAEAATALAVYASDCPWDVSAWVLSAVAQHYARDFAGAVDSWTRAIELRPNTDAYRGRGDARFHRRDYAGALADYEAALRIAPRHLDARCNQALARLELGPGAIEELNAILEDHPEFARGYHARGMAYARSARTLDRAEADFRAAVALRSEYAEAWNGLANVLLMKGEVEDALVAYGKAVDAAPDYADAWMNRGQALEVHAQLLGSNEECHAALADYTRAIELEPREPRGYAKRGLLRIALGVRDSARADLERALEVAPEDWPDRARIRAALEGLR